MSDADKRRTRRRLSNSLRFSRRLARVRDKWSEWSIPPVVRNPWVVVGVYVAMIAMVGYAWFSQGSAWQQYFAGVTPGKHHDYLPDNGYFYTPHPGDIAPGNNPPPPVTAEPITPTTGDDVELEQPGEETQPTDNPSGHASAVTTPDPSEVEANEGPPSGEPAVPVVAANALTRLEYPVEGQVIKPYSLSAAWPTFNDWRAHLAMDFSVPEGTPIGAAAKGTIMEIAEEDFLWGTVIKIDHGGGWVTIYSNVSEPTVQVGQSVAAKQIIGKTSTNPYAELIEHPHLHFELHKDAQPIDPSTKLR